MMLVTLFSLAAAKVGPDPCADGPYASFALPADGTVDVSPDALLVIGVANDCGDGTIDVTLGETQALSVPGAFGLHWLDVDLVTGETYQLQALGYQQLDQAFTVGSG